MAMTACSAKLLTSSICLSVNGPHLLAVDGDRADQLVLLEHRHDEQRASAACIDDGHEQGMPSMYASARPDIRDVHDLLSCATTRSMSRPRIGTDTGSRCRSSSICRRQRCASRPSGSPRLRRGTALPNLASQIRIAFASMDSNTGSSSPGELEMTCSTSEVAGLLLQGFAQIVRALTQLVEQAGVLDGDDGLRGEILDQLDLLVGERPHLLAVDTNGADQLVSLSIGTIRSVRAPRKLGDAAASGSFYGYESATWTTCFVRRARSRLGASERRSAGRVRRTSANVWRRVVQRNATERVAVTKQQDAELRPRRCASHSPASPGTPAPARRANSR